MRAYLDGVLVVEGSLKKMATGYVCDRIELDARDVLALATAQRWPVGDRVAFFDQLAARFKDNRGGDRG